MLRYIYGVHRAQIETIYTDIIATPNYKIIDSNIHLLLLAITFTLGYSQLLKKFLT